MTEAEEIAQLRLKFDGEKWEEHPDHPVSDWVYEASNGDTRLGYWHWVYNELKARGAPC